MDEDTFNSAESKAVWMEVSNIKCTFGSTHGLAGVKQCLCWVDWHLQDAENHHHGTLVALCVVTFCVIHFLRSTKAERLWPWALSTAGTAFVAYWNSAVLVALPCTLGSSDYEIIPNVNGFGGNGMIGGGDDGL